MEQFVEVALNDGGAIRGALLSDNHEKGVHIKAKYPDKEGLHKTFIPFTSFSFMVWLSEDEFNKQ